MATINKHGNIEAETLEELNAILTSFGYSLKDAKHETDMHGKTRTYLKYWCLGRGTNHDYTVIKDIFGVAWFAAKRSF